MDSLKDEPCYRVTVWRVSDGDIEETLWEATKRELDEIEERYEDEWEFQIQVEDLT